jgi:GGDEF domain-containing protein
LLCAVEMSNSAAIQMARCSASIGVAVFPADATQLDELLRFADQAMYAAKLGGGNRVSHDGRAVAVRVDMNSRGV